VKRMVFEGEMTVCFPDISWRDVGYLCFGDTFDRATLASAIAERLGEDGTRDIALGRVRLIIEPIEEGNDD